MSHGQNMVKYKFPQMPKTKFRAQPQKVKVKKPKKTKKKKSQTQIKFLLPNYPITKLLTTA